MKPLASCFFLFCFAQCSAATETVSLAWLDDYPAAVASAGKSGRPLLLNFTGSDWCVWCHRLRDEVFQTPFFAKYAADSLVLVELDYPRQKTLSPELKKQNSTLAEKYAVTGYPTIILLAANGKMLGRLGYMQGGPKTFVRELKRLIATSPVHAAESK